MSFIVPKFSFSHVSKQSKHASLLGNNLTKSSLLLEENVNSDPHFEHFCFLGKKYIQFFHNAGLATIRDFPIVQLDFWFAVSALFSALTSKRYLKQDSPISFAYLQSASEACSSVNTFPRLSIICCAISGSVLFSLSII